MINTLSAGSAGPPSDLHPVSSVCVLCWRCLSEPIVGSVNGNIKERSIPEWQLATVKGSSFNEVLLPRCVSN